MLKKNVNISELAARLGLSKGSVSRILNDPQAPFAPETRRRVMAMAAELEYRPNAIARALATGQTGSVAFWLRDLSTTYNAHVAQAFETQIEAAGYHLFIRLYGGGGEDDGKPFPQMTPENADGIVTHGAPPRGWTSMAQSASRPAPLVLTGAIMDPEAIDWVGIDFYGVSRAAVEHLLAPGRKRVALLTPHNMRDDRRVAYMDVMAEAGLPPEVIEAGGESRSDVRRSLAEYIDAHGYPEAMFCHNDDAAIAACRVLRDLGLQTPGDVALVGCDGIEDIEYLTTPLSTIVLPIDEMCALAWRYLKRRMQEPDAPPQRITLQPALALRASSGVS
ncbi:LacI family transcriptional regulator [Capsulimonas corticalis]|uniref:LacI family transcriptional regulator n=1 Tax=Capsulimonas corticalis TaxID=2219043 RepID=A0A402CUZ0_9BACT|nr:LacI family DNA-binding transcriptional regulator [Capsulimonas corticalis]BDI30223.1 LacI family transcriptional regulator [Capsulimonas corticalis]